MDCLQSVYLPKFSKGVRVQEGGGGIGARVCLDTNSSLRSWRDSQPSVSALFYMANGRDGTAEPQGFANSLFYHLIPSFCVRVPDVTV